MYISYRIRISGSQDGEYEDNHPGGGGSKHQNFANFDYTTRRKFA